MTDADVEAVLALNEESVAALVPMDADRPRAVPQPDRLTLSSARSTARSRRSRSRTRRAPRTTPSTTCGTPSGSTTSSTSTGSRSRRGFRRRGIASALYDAMESSRAPHGRMVCEIYSDPPNDVSIAFHTSRGYREVGHLMPSQRPRDRDDGEAVVTAAGTTPDDLRPPLRRRDVGRRRGVAGGSA